MTPDLDELRARSLRATVALLREQVPDWPANGSLEGRFGGIRLKPLERDTASPPTELEILVDGRPLTVPLETRSTDVPARLGFPTAPAVHPRDVALFLLSAAAQATGRTTRLLYRPFHEIYEADPNGQLTLVGTVDDNDLAHWP